MARHTWAFMETLNAKTLPGCTSLYYYNHRSPHIMTSSKREKQIKEAEDIFMEALQTVPK